MKVAAASANKPRRKALTVGLDRIELSTSALSVLRSNRLSYSPVRGPARYTTGSDDSSCSTVTSTPPTTSLMRL